MSLDKLQEKFLHEASDLIDALEKSVLQLESNRSDETHVEEVFRVMHTFKGTAKMFGYDQVGEFTHYLENIFDDIRARKLNLSDEILDLTLGSVDHIRQLLHHREETDKNFSNHHINILTKLKELSDKKQVITSSDEINSKGVLYLIHFKPHREFLNDGSNPLYLLEDLAALGKCYVRTNEDELPLVENFQPHLTYLSWNILLFSGASEKSIRNEFVFVEDHCDLTVVTLSQENMLEDADFISFLDNYTGRVWSTDMITEFKKSKAQAPHLTMGLKQDNPLRTINQTIKVTYEKIDKLMGIVSELVTTQARLSLFADGVRNQELDEISENVEKLVRQLRDEAFSISLLPVSNLSMRFERLVRDTSKELSKKIRFITTGGDTELDKKIIENLTDPMLHILRNSIDHGIELPVERKLKGKDETGTIELRSYYSGTNVVIEIRDDGSGIDKERVLQKAIEKGIVKANDVLREEEVFELIFNPGFSTAQQITNVSGRGVGMDVVKRAIVGLRGGIEVTSQKDKGTIIRMRLPLSLSIIDGLLVKVDKSKYVIPLTAIDKCYEVESKLIHPDLNDLIVLDGEKVPYINLREVFQYDVQQPDHVNLVVARYDDRKVAIAVDTIIDEYQAVIKPLGQAYKDQDFASGATILGNGTVALVLDTNRLISSLADN